MYEKLCLYAGCRITLRILSLMLQGIRELLQQWRCGCPCTCLCWYAKEQSRAVPTA